MDESIRYIEVLFRNYYRNQFKPPGIPRVSNRELAYQPFSGQGMIRHMGFKSWDEVKAMLAEKAPRHVYMSSAYYRNPSAPDMDSKGWLGADLVFDIDGDHLPTDNCKGAELITLECLNDALSEVRRLVDVLMYEFGIEEKYLRITFSGHRGFHVHVEGPEDILSLGQEERRMIADYLTGKADLTRQIIISSGGKSSIVKPPPLDQSILVKAYGSMGRILAEALKLGKVTVGLIRNNTNELMGRLAIHIDEVVTIDVNRLMRMPNSLHGKTSLAVAELTLSDIDKGIEAVMDKAIVFRKGNPRIRLLQRLNARRILGEEVHVKNPGDEEKLPIYIALYLILTGYARLVD